MSAQSDNLPRPHRLTVDEYRRMAEVGLLAPDLRVELINGEIIDMAPIGSRHAAVVNALARILNKRVDGAALVSVQAPVVLGTQSEPQPDIMLLRPRADEYATGHPSPHEVLLLVEVSESTFRYDSGPKLALYATHKIPEVWIMDVEAKKLHLFRTPARDQYRDLEVVSASATIPVRHLPNVAIDTGELFRLMSGSGQ